MADITFRGYVQPWNKENAQHPSWAMKVAEVHGKKDSERGQTRTYHNIKVSRASGIDLTAFPLDAYVTVKGSQTTESYEVNGEKRYSLTVWADSIDVAEMSPRVKQMVAETRPLVAVVDGDAPF